MQKKSLVEEIVFETLTYLETAGLIKRLMALEGYWMVSKADT